MYSAFHNCHPQGAAFHNCRPQLSPTIVTHKVPKYDALAYSKLYSLPYSSFPQVEVINKNTLFFRNLAEGTGTSNPDGYLSK